MENEWERFEHTGKVEDYLLYRGVADRFKNEEKISDGEELWRSRKQAGGNPYAGVPVGDRNHIETNPYRGIR